MGPRVGEVATTERRGRLVVGRGLPVTFATGGTPGAHTPERGARVGPRPREGLVPGTAGRGQVGPGAGPSVGPSPEAEGAALGVLALVAPVPPRVGEVRSAVHAPRPEGAGPSDEWSAVGVGRPKSVRSLLGKQSVSEFREGRKSSNQERW